MKDLIRLAQIVGSIYEDEEGLKVISFNFV